MKIFVANTIAIAGFVLLTATSSLAATCNGGTTTWTMSVAATSPGGDDQVVSCFEEVNSNVVQPGDVPGFSGLTGLEWLDYTDADLSDPVESALAELGAMSYIDQETPGQNGVREGVLTISGLAGTYSRLFVGLKAAASINPTSVIFEIVVGTGSATFDYIVDPKAGGAVSHATLYGIRGKPDDPDGQTPIPLPAAGWLLLGALGGLAAMKKRRKPAT